MSNVKIWDMVYYGGLVKMKFDTATNVKINSTKRDLAKAKGFKLQDLLDKALDYVLELDNMNSNIAFGTNDLKLEKEKVENEIKEAETNRELDIERVTKKYDDDIRNLELTKANLLKEINESYDDKINGLKFRISFIDERISEAEEMDLDQRHREFEREDYLKLKKLYIDNDGAYDKVEDLNLAIATHLRVYDFLTIDELLERLDTDFKQYQKDKYGMIMIK